MDVGVSYEPVNSTNNQIYTRTSIKIMNFDWGLKYQPQIKTHLYSIEIVSLFG